MQRVRRLWLLMFVYLLGAITYAIGFNLLLIILVPTSFMMLMLHDEASYKRKENKNGKEIHRV